MEARISVNFDTPLHVSVGTGGDCIVEYFWIKMPLEQLALRNNDGNTVLSVAAIVGNVKAAKLIVRIPLLEAARHGEEDVLKYLLEFSRDHLLQSFQCSANKPGVSFMNLPLIAGFYDLALELLHCQLGLCTVELHGGDSLLSTMARNPTAFLSGTQFKFWHRVAYHCIYLKHDKNIRAFSYGPKSFLFREEVEKIVQPTYKVDKNSQGKTPAMVFTEEHKELVKEGEKWMKDTASSCTVAATLIATIVFAAAITIPRGNNNDTGHPIFSKKKAFIIFGTFSLFSSVAAILMFLSVLTARYAEVDFLHVLPKRLIWGLVTLFLSITSMLVAFSSTVYLVFCDEKAWMLIPIGAVAYSNMGSRDIIPLLVDMISSTYGPGIFW